MSLYEAERARLCALAKADDPQGEYLQPVFGKGTPEAEVLLIGEAPGAEETRQGTPFVGKAGKQLDALLQTADIARTGIYITNVVKYRPVVRGDRHSKNRTPSREEIKAALPLLRNEILCLSCNTIVTLGNVPLTAIYYLDDRMEKGKTIGEMHGSANSVMIAQREFTLFPLYHPASGIYNRALLPIMAQDAAMLGEHLVKQK